MNRIQAYSSISTILESLSNEELTALIKSATPLHVGIDGKSFKLALSDNLIFVKKIPLSDVEMRPHNFKSTANLYSLPMFCQYGIGAPGFGSWRELIANQLATKWVLSNECDNFSLLYHWRVLPAKCSKAMSEEQQIELEKNIQFWENSDSVRSRYMALHNPAAEISLFIEFVPQTLFSWIRNQYKLGAEIFEQSLAFAEKSLISTIAFMNNRGLIHFDAHFENIMTDGQRLYFNDLGLALSKEFDLNEEEIDFLNRHRDYDLCRASVGLMHAVITSIFGDENWKDNLRKALDADGINLSLNIKKLVRKYAPLAFEVIEFSQKLKNESKRSQYPASRVSELITCMK